MRYWLGAFIGVVVFTSARADAQNADAPPKAVKDQVADLDKAFEAKMKDLNKQFQNAKTDEEKIKIRDMALKYVPGEFAKKAMSLAVNHPKDPAAEDALVWICTTPYVLENSQAADAVKILLQDHAGSARLADVCEGLLQRSDADSLIRRIREKAKNATVKLEADFFLAKALLEIDNATHEQNKEAEQLFTNFLTAAKKATEVPPEMVVDAEVQLSLFAGKPAPTAVSKDLNGKPVNLADYKGKVVVLDFWFTGCPPCRRLIPHERELVKKYSGSPFVLISVSADDNKEDLTDFLKDEPMPWVHWFSSPKGDPVKAWRIHSYPTMFIIDAKGVIRGKIRGDDPKSVKRLDELVEKLVKEAS